MESFFNRLHERRESLKRDELSRRDQWREDERMVRNGSRDFTVKYLGCIEVNESKGIHVLENAVQTLKHGDLESQFSLFKNRSKTLDSLYHFGTLHVSGEGLRFVEDSTDDVLVESPIEKISFCGPVEKGKYFGYICREEIHWKRICHAFKVTEDHADRINNAVGCAFHICLERRHIARMEKESKAAANATPSVQTTALGTQNCGGSVGGQPGTSAAPTLTSAYSGLSTPVAASAPSQVSQESLQKVEPPHIDLFDRAWESKAPRDAHS